MRHPLTYLAVVLLLTSCLKNDLPYPVVIPSVESVSIDDAVSVRIDNETRTIEAVLKETADLSKVNVSDVRFSDDITVCTPSMTSVHDLNSPKSFTLHTYQDYEWTLSATCPIERRFAVQGQVGSSVIDDANRRAVAYVSSSFEIDQIRVLSLKLGPEGITSYSPAIGEIHDFTHGAQVDVTVRGVTEKWMLYVVLTDVSVQMDYVEPWTRVAHLAASGVSGRDNGFRYHRAGDADWYEVDGVIETDGSFKACLEGLDPLTSYECYAYSGDEQTAVCEFVTEGEQQLPNAGFETFSHSESGNYHSFFDPSAGDSSLRTKWWDSGNAGSTMIGSSFAITIPDEDCREGQYSVQLKSRYVVIKFAAGNIFSGEFAGLVGTQGGIVNFGRPFTLRPRALKLWMKYVCGAVDCIGSYPDSDPVKTGDPDRCQIFVALGDWDYHKYGGTRDCPVQVNTTEKGTFFEKDSDAVIAYGSFVSAKSSDGWQEITIPLEYGDVTRKPTHIIVSCASSMLGDYFTGSSQSRLYLDDLRLIY